SNGRGYRVDTHPAGPTDGYRRDSHAHSITSCEPSRGTRDWDATSRMLGPPHGARRAAPGVGPRRVRPLLQPGQTASHTRTPDARAETTPHDRSDPAAAGAERTPSRL